MFVIQFIRSGDNLVMAEGKLDYITVFEDDICAALAQLQGTAGQNFYPKVRMGPPSGQNSDICIQIEIGEGDNYERN